MAFLRDKLKFLSSACSVWFENRFRTGEYKRNSHNSLNNLYLYLFIFILQWSTAFGQTAAHAKNPSYSAYEVKAAYLYNFSKFVEWPVNAFENSGSPFIIGILGNDPFDSSLELIVTNKMVNNRNIKVICSKKIKDLEKCHILFINLSEEYELAEIIEKIKNLPVLTVSETEGFAQLGGIINFVMKQNNVSFEINVNAARQAGLKINSRVLQLAKIITDKDKREQ